MPRAPLPVLILLPAVAFTSVAVIPRLFACEGACALIRQEEDAYGTDRAIREIARLSARYEPLRLTCPVGEVDVDAPDALRKLARRDPARFLDQLPLSTERERAALLLTAAEERVPGAESYLRRAAASDPDPWIRSTIRRRLATSAPGP